MKVFILIYRTSLIAYEWNRPTNITTLQRRGSAYEWCGAGRCRATLLGYLPHWPLQNAPWVLAAVRCLRYHKNQGSNTPKSKKNFWGCFVILNVCERSPRRLHIQHIINRHPEEGQAQGVVEWDTLTMPRRGDLPLFNGGGERLVSVSAKHYNQW